MIIAEAVSALKYAHDLVPNCLIQFRTLFDRQVHEIFDVKNLLFRHTLPFSYTSVQILYDICSPTSNDLNFHKMMLSYSILHDRQAMKRISQHHPKLQL
ncbi:MAG: hypothetical protein US13_C0001G0003 [candidate division TM6 bacterium GW2011_GWE2_36_25]|nr:MAG: hypothetical protein US03_C0001G0201 [candidate division TM6 bacterium GW2011_GWF2_36_131]KKQ03663.1 MAG: hypothetical protein US13_C0001G0003 [candidate division TM6 bacterium GW2011_GWE2_36_25]KKQ18342.1 MAG: hypothetical protein US32_C0027G0009 [candidate division TM6 bacterium GW2011_GWA2_36_9]